MFVCCECCLLSGRGLCDELITRPGKSYRLWCVVVCDLETSRMRRPWPALSRSATKEKKNLRLDSTALTLLITLCFKTLNGKATFSLFNIFLHKTWSCQSLCPRGPRRGSAAALLLGSRVRIPPPHPVEVLPSVVCLTARDDEAPIMMRPWRNRGCCAMGRNIRRKVNVLETVVMTNRGMLTSVTINVTSKLECDSQTYSFETLLDWAPSYLPISSEWHWVLAEEIVVTLAVCAFCM
jgi:hypothetical protein